MLLVKFTMEVLRINFNMLMINIIPIRQKIHLIRTDYYSEHKVYVIALARVRTLIAWVRVYHANHCPYQDTLNDMYLNDVWNVDPTMG